MAKNNKKLAKQIAKAKEKIVKNAFKSIKGDLLTPLELKHLTDIILNIEKVDKPETTENEALKLINNLIKKYGGSGSGMPKPLPKPKPQSKPKQTATTTVEADVVDG